MTEHLVEEDQTRMAFADLSELIRDAPYRRVAWIDADAVVLRGLKRLFR